MPRLRKSQRASKHNGSQKSTKSTETPESACAQRIVAPLPTNLLKAGYSLVQNTNRDLWRSPGGRVYLPNSDRFAKKPSTTNVKPIN